MRSRLQPSLLVIFTLNGWLWRVSLGFSSPAVTSCFRQNPATSQLQMSEVTPEDTSGLSSIKQILKDEYPGMYLVWEQNDAVWKALNSDSASNEFTLFAPNAQAIEALGEARQGQLLDPRNLETTEKIGAYHAILGDTVSAEELFNAGGVVTLGGEVMVDRSTTGGLFGMFGAKEDGGVTLNGAKVVRSLPLGQGGVLHEVDAFISPNILWRYMDQLRIPGSR